jgi:hypothetical protein
MPLDRKLPTKRVQKDSVPYKGPTVPQVAPNSGVQETPEPEIDIKRATTRATAPPRMIQFPVNMAQTPQEAPQEPTADAASPELEGLPVSLRKIEFDQPDTPAAPMQSDQQTALEPAAQSEDTGAVAPKPIRLNPSLVSTERPVANKPKVEHGIAVRQPLSRLTPQPSVPVTQQPSVPQKPFPERSRVDHGIGVPQSAPKPKVEHGIVAHQVKVEHKVVAPQPPEKPQVEHGIAARQPLSNLQQQQPKKIQFNTPSSHLSQQGKKPSLGLPSSIPPATKPFAMQTLAPQQATPTEPTAIPPIPDGYQSKKPSVKEGPPFWQDIPGLFGYPFRDHGVFALIISSVFFSVVFLLLRFSLFFGLLMSIALMGYIFAFLVKVTKKTIKGDPHTPDWPDFGGFFNYALQWFTLIFVPIIGPIILYGYICSRVHMAGSPWVVLFLVLLGLFYIPMAILVFAVYESLTDALNPIFVMGSISKVFTSYILVVASFYVLYLISYLVQILAGAFPLAFIFQSFISFYFLMVIFRMLGLFYLNCQKRLGWFNE